MKWAASITHTLILIAVLVVGAYIYRDQVKVFAEQAVYEVAPCSMPVTYSVGSIDPRFGISTSSFVSAMQAATAAWNAAAGKTLFTYEPSGGLVSVGLVYDTRQETTQQLSSIGGQLSGAASSYDALKSQYDATLATYKREKASFDSQYADYASRSAAYEEEVNRWNARGGAPASTYQSLQAEKASLDSDEAQLEQLQNTVNADADTVNSMVGELNTLAKQVNSDAATYNTVGKATGSEFEEGVFTSAPGSESIDIYEYDSIARLTRVLEHEFGHSLGLQHVDDSAAVMYRLNEGTTTTLTSADIAELKAVCKLP